MFLGKLSIDAYVRNETETKISCHSSCSSSIVISYLRSILATSLAKDLSYFSTSAIASSGLLSAKPFFFLAVYRRFGAMRPFLPQLMRSRIPTVMTNMYYLWLLDKLSQQSLGMTHFSNSLAHCAVTKKQFTKNPTKMRNGQIP